MTRCSFCFLFLDEMSIYSKQNYTRRTNNINHIFGTETLAPPLLGSSMQILLIDDTSDALLNTRTSSSGRFWISLIKLRVYFHIIKTVSSRGLICDQKRLIFSAVFVHSDFKHFHQTMPQSWYFKYVLCII